MPIPATISLTNDNISDKLAADSRFIELIKVELSFQTKFRSLSAEDKKLFLTALKEKKTSTMLVLFTKCGIDFNIRLAVSAGRIAFLYKFRL